MSVSFLAPTDLLLLGLLAVIAAAYLLRMPRRRLRVPDVRIARMALADSSRINRQKRALIALAIQAAILILLAGAAALPFLGDTTRPVRSTIVLLDVSASMKADDAARVRALRGDDEAPPPAPEATRFARAAAAVRGLARDMRPGDRMMLMTVGKTPDVVLNFQGDPGVVAHTLASIAPASEEANFADACGLAGRIAGSLTGTAEVVVVTDGAVRPADCRPLAALSAQRPGAVKWVTVGRRIAGAGNLGITTFRVRKDLDSPADYEALVSILNATDAPRQVEVDLLLDGAVFDVATVSVAPGAEAAQVFREKLRVGGVLEARLRVADALADDNIAWEVLRPVQRLRVLLVSDDTSASSFLVRAIGSNAGAVDGMVLTPEQYRQSIAPSPSVLADQRDAVIFDRWAPAKAEELPPTHVMAIDCAPPVMPVAAGEPFDKPLIRKWDQGHPLMSYLNLRNVFVSTARRVTVAAPAKGQPPVERVAETVTSPLVLAWERPLPNSAAAADSDVSAHPQRFVVLALDPRQSDIVLRKELPLLLWNSFLWFQQASGDEPQTQVAPGQTIALMAGGGPGAAAAGEPARPATAAVTVPGGRVQTVPIDPRTGRADFGGTSAAGVYRYANGKQEGAFVVNAGQRFESDVRPAEDLGFHPELLDPARLAALSPAGRALWPYLLWAAAVLLAFEAIVYHRRICF